MILRIILTVLVFFISLGIFFPKYEALNYTIQQYARQYDLGLAVSEHKGIFSDALIQSELSYNGEEIAKIELTELLSLFFYNKITMENIELQGLPLGFIPPTVSSFTLRYHIFDPLNILIHGKGDFGTLEGSFKVSENKLLLQLSPSNIMLKKYNFILGKGKKQEKAYLYEFNL